MYTKPVTFRAFMLIFLTALLCPVQSIPAVLQPVRTVVDLNTGETASIKLSDGSTVTLTLLDMGQKNFAPTGAVMDSWVRTRVGNDTLVLHAARYNLPVDAGNIQIDCPVTRTLYANTTRDAWALKKDARFRLWPKNSPWIKPGTFMYPIEQKWFASKTQMANEPVHVDGGHYPGEKIYYHNGLDFGGAEGLDRVVAATDGLVVSAGDSVLPEFADSPVVRPRYDVIYIEDDRGWLYRYSHFWAFHLALKPGTRVRMGQYLGILGKEGGSGGWSHLHFAVHSPTPGGEWGTEEGYAFLWQAYQQQYAPDLVAVARPYIYAHAGETVVLNGQKSWARAGIEKAEWQLSDGSRSSGLNGKISYSRPGQYNEILKITDRLGNTAYDAVAVTVFDTTLAPAQQVPPTVHAVYYPSLRILPGDPVTFLVRSFDTFEGQEKIDFGDGESVTVYSQTGFNGNVQRFMGLDAGVLKDNHHLQGYARAVHRYRKPGTYTATITHTAENGHTAMMHLFITIVNVME